MNKNDKAKSNNGSSNNNKVQGFVFGINLEGDSQVVMEGIKAFTSAMTKSGSVLTAPIARPILPSSPTGKTKSSASAAVIDQTETSEEVPEEQFEAGQQEVETETEEETPSNGSGKPRTYNHRPPKFLDDLDLSKAKQPIADFIAAKGNPTEQNDRYIAIAVWLNESMGIEEFTINHIFTVFDNLGWKSQMPVNHSQPLRDLKTKRHFLTKEANGYKVNWNGIQYVGKMGSN